MSSTRLIAAWLIATMAVVCSVKAADTRSELDSLRKELNDLKRKADAQAGGPVSRSGVERALDNRYGPNAPVSTKSGKLQIGGLTQIWFTAYQKDNRGLFDKTGGGPLPDTNEGQDNSSFRVRRTEIKFGMDIHENVTGVVMIDPAREATSFPYVTDNQINTSIFKTINQVAPEFDKANGPGLGSTTNITNVQTGSGSAPRLLQDAYINYHGVIPHHDFQVGQFKPWMGEEGIRNSGQLDFVERSFVGFLNDVRDLGATVHGSWWDDRVQYWAGVFDGAGNYFGTAGQFQNRTDDNNEKDYNWRILARPVWKSECWGSLEIGGSGKGGRHGANLLAGRDPIAAPVNGLNRERTWAEAYDAWLYYAPSNECRGLWIRGEWEWMKDRNNPNTVADADGNGASSSAGFQQTNGKPLSVWGAYGAIGYKFSDCCFCDSGPSCLKGFEFVARVDYFTNVLVANAVDPSETDAYRTIVYTGGFNYYIKGHDAKIQVDVNSVRNPEGSAAHKFHDVRNNSLMANFQVAF
jgi:hypothetical protein